MAHMSQMSQMSQIVSEHSKIYLKSLSGDITPISLSSIFSTEDNIWDRWNRIAYIISSENNCAIDQVIIFGGEEDEKNYTPPVLVPEAQYNFFIRDENYYRYNFTVLMVSSHIVYEDSDQESITYKKYSVSIRLVDGNGFDSSVLYDTSDTFRNFDIYQQLLGSPYSLFFHQKNVVTHGVNKIKTTDEGSFSMYSVLWENLSNVPWYDKTEIISRIMTQYDTIENRFQSEEYQENYEYRDLDQENIEYDNYDNY